MGGRGLAEQAGLHHSPGSRAKVEEVLFLKMESSKIDGMGRQSWSIEVSHLSIMLLRRTNNCHPRWELAIWWM